MSAREDILRRIRAATEADAPPPLGQARRTARSRRDVVARFAERVADQRAPVRHVAADELPTVMAAMLWAREAKRVAVPPDLPPDWLIGLDGVRALADAPPLELSVLAESDGVLTGCALAVAETGTLVLDEGRAQGRRALTLVPPHHLCVVHADQIVATLAEAFERIDPYRPLTWISGPSDGRTLEVLVMED
jgi:L-lactate dehydrogenase complex protein LldG